MYPFVGISNFASPSAEYLFDQTIFSMLSTQYGIFPSLVFGSTCNSNNYSPVSSTSITGINEKVCAIAKRAPGPVRNKQQRAKAYCKICQNNITEEGKRSQGPRRHILQHHLCRPIFFCPLCPASSNYDKAHIKTHMKKIHKGSEEDVIETEKRVFAEEEKRWFKRCFGEGSDYLSNAIGEDQQSMKPELKSEQKDADDAKKNFTPSSSSLAPILFSIDRILGKET